MLVPLDGSKLAEKALPDAADLAARMSLSVHLLSVCSATDEEGAHFFREYLEMVAENVAERVTAIRKELCIHASTEPALVNDEVVVGHATEEILNYSDQRDVGLICMAIHGRSGIRHWAFGSVAAKVLRKSSVPVFLVPAAMDVDVTTDTCHCEALLVPLWTGRNWPRASFHMWKRWQSNGPARQLR